MHTQGKGHVKMEAEIGAIHLQAQERQPPPEASVTVSLQLSETNTAGELSTGIPGEAEETPRRLLYD